MTSKSFSEQTVGGLKKVHSALESMMKYPVTGGSADESEDPEDRDFLQTIKDMDDLALKDRSTGEQPELQGGGEILLIEDNPDDVDLITRILREHFPKDQKITHSDTVAGAEEYIRAHGKSVWIILLDLNLPDTVGQDESFMRIRKVSGDTPIVVLTGSQNHDLALSLVKQGAEDFICKSQLFYAPDSLRNAMQFAVCRHNKPGKGPARATS